MATVTYEPLFEKKIRKIRDSFLKAKVKKQMEKIVNNPETGKPMMYSRKGTREVYVDPFRLSYFYSDADDKLVFLDIYHKDEQ